MLVLKNEIGVVKKVDVGFSLPVAFFGFIAVLFKGMVKEAMVWLGISFLINFLVNMLYLPYFLNLLLLGAYGFYMAATINKKQIINLLEQGYAPATEKDKEILVKEGILAE